MEPEPCRDCGYFPCQCQERPPVEKPGREEGEGTGNPPPPRKKIRVKLADGKDRTIQHMLYVQNVLASRRQAYVGTGIHGAFVFGELPEFFRDEAEPRAILELPRYSKEIA